MSPRVQAPILTVAGAAHAYGRQEVLRGVDLSLHGGEIYALLGPNGAGKTTLIRAICGRLKPDSGEVRLSGEDPWAHPAVRRTLGLAPQELALYPQLTVRENLEAFASLAGVKRADTEAAVQRAMTLSRTLDRQHVPVRHLSGGYQRRVNIAAAIIHQPRLLILDEPTVGVDLNAREAVDQVVRDLRDQGVAILMITHDLEQAGELADRVGFLREGLKVLEGEPGALIAEAFGSQMEVMVQLAAEPGTAGEIRLASEGLALSRSGNFWTLLSDDGYGVAGRLDPKLRKAGLAVREIRVRQPTLQHLFTLVAERRRAA